jgi:cell division septation protein DedD
MTYFMKSPALIPPRTGIFRLIYLSILSFFCLASSHLAAQPAYYHLIAGSFDEFSAASEMVSTLKAKGKDPVLLFPGESSERYRVSAFQSLNRAEVAAYHKDLKRQGEGKTYWILSLSPQANRVDPANLRTSSQPLPTDGTGNIYHLIVGSFDDFDAADRSVTALEEQGYEPYVLMPGGQVDHYRVSVYRSMDREEIEAYGSLLRKRGKQNGWIYEEEPGTTTTFNQPMASDNARLTPGTELRASSANNQTYHLIAGSFERFDQASKFADLMRNQGYNPFIMFPEMSDGKTFRVSVYQSTQRNRVEAFKQNLAQQGTKGWILAQ